MYLDMFPFCINSCLYQTNPKLINFHCTLNSHFLFAQFILCNSLQNNQKLQLLLKLHKLVYRIFRNPIIILNRLLIVSFFSMVDMKFKFIQAMHFFLMVLRALALKQAALHSFLIHFALIFQSAHSKETMA